MARQTPDGRIKLYFVTTLSSMTSPTLVQITAGTALHSFLTPAGISFPDEGSEADVSDLGSARDKSAPATVSGNPEGEFWRDDALGGGADTAWTTLVRDTTGYLVVALFGGSGALYALQAADKVDVWPVRVSSRNLSRPARGEGVKFTSVFAVTGGPYYASTVA
jgi:hypothetical protein